MVLCAENLTFYSLLLHQKAVLRRQSLAWCIYLMGEDWVMDHALAAREAGK